jgi:anti-sigma factor (TIGR02949 family)
MNTEFSCQEMIEVVTEYLDDALPADERQRFERHISYCKGCNTYTEQIRQTIGQTRTVAREDSLPPALREAIIAQFRTWRQR